MAKSASFGRVSNRSRRQSDVVTESRPEPTDIETTLITPRMAEIPDIKVDDPITEVIPSVKQV